MCDYPCCIIIFCLLRHQQKNIHRTNSLDHVRKLVEQEGRAARNLVTWSVPVTDPDEEGITIAVIRNTPWCKWKTDFSMPTLSSIIMIMIYRLTDLLYGGSNLQVAKKTKNFCLGLIRPKVSFYECLGYFLYWWNNDLQPATCDLQIRPAAYCRLAC